MSLIPPLIHNNSLITDFKQKADRFYNFFAAQCTTSVLSYKTNSRLSFENDDILKLIRSLNSQKAHDPDDISICMIKICDSTLF